MLTLRYAGAILGDMMKSARTCLLLALFMSVFYGVSAESAPGREPPRVALVLKGGGALGIAHVGVIKVLEELGISPDLVVGTSMGSIVGGLYSMGYSAAELDSIVRGIRWTDVFSEPESLAASSFRERQDRSKYALRFAFTRDGFSLGSGILSGRNALAIFDRLSLPHAMPADFDTLPRRFRAVASDLSSRESVVLSGGSISDAMRASMSIPGVFEPYRIGERYYVDGGVLDNLPINVARSLGAKTVIAVNLVDNTPREPGEIGSSVVETLSRTLDVLTEITVRSQLENADFVIDVDISGFGPYSFDSASVIIERGESSARAEVPRLTAFMKGPSYAGDAPPDVTLPPVPVYIPALAAPLERLRVLGGTERDRALVRRLLEKNGELAADDKTLSEAYAALSSTGRFRTVRMTRESEGPTLLVTLEPTKKPVHEAHAGFTHRGTYSDSLSNFSVVTQGVTLRNLTGAGSRCTFDVGFNGALTAEATYLQPFGGLFFVEPAVSYMRELDTYRYDSSVGLQFETTSLSMGGTVGLFLSRYAELSVGWSANWIDSSALPSVETTEGYERYFLTRARFDVSTLDSALFSTGGFALRAQYTTSSVKAGSSRDFSILETSGEFSLSFDSPYSVTVRWMAGTDFSEASSHANASPLYYRPTLGDRLLFPNPMTIDERTGCHVAGVGIGAKRRWNLASSFINLPVFVLVNAACGVTAQDRADLREPGGIFHWNSTLGAGLRFNDGFAVALRGGVSRNITRDYIPFIALDIGVIR